MANNLFANLLDAQYELTGADNRFLSSLVKEIPFVPGRTWEKTGILAEIPARMVAGLKGQIAMHRGIAKRLEAELAEL